MTVKIVLKLFVVGDSGKSARAISNLQEIAAQHLGEQAVLEIIDILREPELAVEEHILATPSLVKSFPPSRCKVIGDLSDREQVLSALGLHSVKRET